MSWCIYRITNLINGKTYIGQHRYKKLDDEYMGSGVLIKRAIKKHGIENFKKEILYSRIQYRETADDMERFAIAKERAIGKAEYNIANGGMGSAGFHYSEEYKKKMSESKMGHFVSEETKRKLSEATRRNMTEERKKEISESLKGHFVSKKSRKKMSESHKGKQGYWQGKHLSEETKRKLSESQKGKINPIKQEMLAAYKKSGRKDWNTFQREYKENKCV